MTPANLPQSSLMLLSVGLFIMMIGVAIEVKKADWVECLNHPAPFIITLFFQIICIPLLALVLTSLFPVSNELKLGILFISLCPGGIVSNFFSLQAGGNPALSSFTTLISSMLVPITLPLGLLVFSVVYPDIVIFDDTNLLLTVSQISVVLIVPALIIGGLLRYWNSEFCLKILPLLKLFSLFLIAIIVISTLYNNREILVEEIKTVFPMTFIFNALLLLIGFWVGRLFQYPTHICRTLSLELGIQNIGIALLVVPTLFPNSPTMINIIAFWGVWHLISGVAVSQYWKLRPCE